MTRRVLITASRKWNQYEVLAEALEKQYRIAQANNEDLVVVHGNAEGGDRLAQQWVKKCGYTDVDEDPHTPDWNRYGKAAGAIRNSTMVKKGADVCLAFPLPDSIGTLDCMKKADQAEILVINLGDKRDTDDGREG